MAKAKICGIKSPDTMDAALAGGADFVGLVFYPRSPRHLDFTVAQRLAAQARNRAAIVALLVDPDDALVRDVAAAIAPDYLQLHGRETPERLREIASLSRTQLIKAIAVESHGDAAAARKFKDLARFILFDAKPPRNQADALPGGNGLSFDWTSLEGVRGEIEFMLSGGLTPDNVATAIAATGAAAVDVSSGVETAPGVKSPELIRRFLIAAKTAKQSPEN